MFLPPEDQGRIGQDLSSVHQKPSWLRTAVLSTSIFRRAGPPERAEHQGTLGGSPSAEFCGGAVACHVRPGVPRPRRLPARDIEAHRSNTDRADFGRRLRAQSREGVRVEVRSAGISPDAATHSRATRFGTIVPGPKGYHPARELRQQLHPSVPMPPRGFRDGASMVTPRSPDRR